MTTVPNSRTAHRAAAHARTTASASAPAHAPAPAHTPAPTAAHPPITPPREDWPDPPPHTDTGAALTDVVIATFQLNSRLMEDAQHLARKGGITATEWQVLGGVLDAPHSVAEIGRSMGMTRQGVQRVADLLVERRLAEYRPNPAHQRAKLLACTESGYWAVRQISLVQHPWTNRIGAQIGTPELRATLATMQRLVATLDADDVAGGTSGDLTRTPGLA